MVPDPDNPDLQIRKGMKAVPKVRIGWNAYSYELYGRTMPARTFDQLRKLFTQDLPAGKHNDTLDPAHEIVRANMDMDGDDDADNPVED